jgi:hypothetical protein
MEIGSMRRRGFQRKAGFSDQVPARWRHGTFARGCGWPRKAEHAIHPPIHLVVHPDEPIRSLEAARKVIRRHAGDRPDGKAQELLRRIKGASTPEEADAAGKAFRAYLRSRIAAIALTWLRA